MKINLIVVLGALAIGIGGYSWLSGPDNWPECILEQMPGVQNNYAAGAVIQNCTRDFGAPQTEQNNYNGNGRYKSGDLCVIETAKDTTSDLAARVIYASCHMLYDHPTTGQNSNNLN